MMADSSKFLKTLLPSSSLTMMDICFLIKNPRLHIYIRRYFLLISGKIFPHFCAEKWVEKKKKYSFHFICRQKSSLSLKFEYIIRWATWWIMIYGIRGSRYRDREKGFHLNSHYNPFKSNGSLRLFTSIVFCNQREKKFACLKWRVSGCNRHERVYLYYRV